MLKNEFASLASRKLKQHITTTVNNNYLFSAAIVAKMNYVFVLSSLNLKNNCRLDTRCCKDAEWICTVITGECTTTSRLNHSDVFLSPASRFSKSWYIKKSIFFRPTYFSPGLAPTSLKEQHFKYSSFCINLGHRRTCAATTFYLIPTCLLNFFLNYHCHQRISAIRFINIFCK